MTTQATGEKGSPTPPPSPADSPLPFKEKRHSHTAITSGEQAPRSQASLYRVIWRWHFYAGILVGPVLFVVALTGAMYVFKDELERVIYPSTMFVTPQADTLSLDRQADIVAEAFPDWRVDTIEVDADPTRAISVRIRDHSSRSQRVYVNPHTGTIQGVIGDDSLFRVILAIHRRLFIGTTGRIIVEVVTCWTIVLLITGLYLWFPRRRKNLKGVLLPRLRAKPYTVLRDLHAISGALLMPIALVIAGTGLIYTWGWGTLYRYASVATEEPPETPPPLSPTGTPPSPLDRAVNIARAYSPGASFIDVQIPADLGAPLIARTKTGGQIGPRNRTVMTLDRSTGEVIAIQMSDQLPLLSWWRTTWNYPLHVGSVLGTPTKILWLMVCLVVALLPVTGLCMWWQRRPEGQNGFPRHLKGPRPWWLISIIALLSLLLPALGATILLVWGGELVVCRVRNWRAATCPPQSA